jgi:hypothetical protein
MFSSLQHFELKSLSLGGIIYLSAIALMCLLYLELDRPSSNSNADLWQYPEPQYWVTYEFSKELHSKDVHNVF